MPGLEDVPYVTNETIFDLTERPEHLIVLGGGPIGCDRGVPHLLLYDVAYYVSFTDTAKAAAVAYGLPILAEAPPFTVFALPASSLVERQPGIAGCRTARRRSSTPPSAGTTTSTRWIGGWWRAGPTPGSAPKTPPMTPGGSSRRPGPSAT